jgi:hypothetical protein
MSSLAGKTLLSTYTSLLKLVNDTQDLVAGGGTAIQVKTGDDEATPIYLNTDRIGIGTALPLSVLHVESTVDEKFRLSYDANDYMTIATGSSGQTTITTVSNATAGHIILAPDGNVGIGEVAPATSLEIRKDSTSTAEMGNNALLINNQTGNVLNRRVGIGFANFSSGAETGAIETISEGTGAHTSMAVLVHNGTSNIERLRLNSKGNLGIGTASFQAASLGYLAIANGTSPGATTAGQIYIGAKDSSAGSTHSTLTLFCEQAVETSAPTIAHKMRIWINDVEYWIGLDPV